MKIIKKNKNKYLLIYIQFTILNPKVPRTKL